MSESSPDLIAPRLFEVRVPLGNIDWIANRNEPPEFAGFRRFLAEVFDSEYRDDLHSLEIHGLHQVTFGVHKASSTVVELSIWTDAPREIDAIVSGEVGDLLRLTPGLGVMVGPIDKISASFLFFEYDRLLAIRRAPQWPDWLEGHKEHYDTLEAEWQRVIDGQFERNIDLTR